MQKASSLLGAQYRVCGLTRRFLQRTKKKRDFLRLLIEVAVVGFVRLKLGEIKRTACDFAVFASSTVLGKDPHWRGASGSNASGSRLLVASRFATLSRALLQAERCSRSSPEISMVENLCWHAAHSKRRRLAFSLKTPVGRDSITKTALAPQLVQTRF